MSERSSPPHGLISISDARSARHPRSPAVDPAAPLTAADCDQLAHRRIAVLSLCCPCRCAAALQAQLSVGQSPGDRPVSQPAVSRSRCGCSGHAPPVHSSRCHPPPPRLVSLTRPSCRGSGSGHCRPPRAARRAPPAPLASRRFSPFLRSPGFFSSPRFFLFLSFSSAVTTKTCD